MSSIDNTTIQIVNALFEKLIRIKPAFKQAWPTDHEFQMVKREWFLSFQRNGINSLNQIKRGIEKITDAPSSFIPSPGEFIALCKTTPEDIGAPDINTAYHEAIKNAYPDGNTKKWSHELVRHAFHKSDPYYLRTAPAKDTRKVFESNYLEAINDYLNQRNLNQIEGKKDYKFTDVEMHWIMSFKKCIDNNIDPHKSTYFPDKETVDCAGNLYSKWLRST